MFVKLGTTLAVVALLSCLAIEYLSMKRADGGGTQIVTLNVEQVSEISGVRYALLYQSQNPSDFVNAFASTDTMAIYNCLADLEQLFSISNVTGAQPVEFRQQWSFTEMGLTKRRPHYTQTFAHAVFSIRYKDGDSTQHVIELPAYCQPTEIDVSRTSGVQ